MNFPPKVCSNLIKVWPQWGQALGFSRRKSYDVADRLPPGVRVKIGGSLYLNTDKFAAYIDAGGDLAKAQ